MYYNLEKTASTLGLSTGDVNRLREKGELRAYRDGGNWKFRKEDVDKYLAKMIKERSQSPSDDLLTSDDDDEQTIAATDSAAFDRMFEEGENYIRMQGESTPDNARNDDAKKDDEPMVFSFDDDELALAPEEDATVAAAPDLDDADDLGLELAPEENDAKSEPAPLSFEKDDSHEELALAPEDDDLQLAPENDDNGLSLAKEDDDLQLAPEGGDNGLSLAKEDDDLQLAPENDDNGGLSLVKEEESGSLTGEDSALAEDLALAPEGAASKIDLTADAPVSGSGSAGSDGDLHLGGDSGLSLMDELDGSNVDLANADDLVLGGSGSGSGSGLDLSGGSGLSLLGDSDADFDIDGAVEENAAPQSDDDGIFELAPDANSVLNLVKDADEDAPTELAATDESVFDLADESSVAAASETDSETGSLFTIDDDSKDATGDDDIFSTDDSTDAAKGSGEDDNLFSLSGDQSTDSFAAPDSVSSDIDLETPSFDSSSASTDNDPFADLGPTSTASPFTSGSETFEPMAPSAGASDYGGFASGDAISGVSSTGFTQESGAQPAPSAQSSGLSSMTFTGKDLIFLVPCLIFLILATIGALELCRTIWSYEEGVADVGGPILEMVGKILP